MKVEAKQHALRSGSKPEPHYQLSGVVKVITATENSLAYIRFNASFVDAVGSKMPRGVSVDDPCYLMLEENTATKKWTLFGKYLYTDEKVMLKVYSELPGWVKLKGHKHGDKSKKG